MQDKKQLARFQKGQSYSSDQLKEILGSHGTWGQVVVLSGQDIRCIRFQMEQNPNWCTHHELWIQKGERRVPDAKRWTLSRVVMPIFVGNKKDKAGSWNYLGNGSASVIYAGKDAEEYTRNKDIALVLKMHFSIEPVKSQVVILKRKSA